MKEDYDVIVVGAGPAGSLAAQNAAAESDVLLIEKRQEIGAPVRCAEAVPLVETPQVFHTSFEKYVKPDTTGSQAKSREFGLSLLTARR